MRRLAVLGVMLLMLGYLFAKVTVISSDGNVIIAEYETEPWKIVTEGDFVRIIAENMDYNSLSGAPLLPQDEFKLGIPPGGEVSYQILSSESTEHQLSSRLIPVPEVVERDGLSDYNYVINPELYNGFSGESFAMLAQGVFRGLGFVPIAVKPFSYDGQYTLKVLTKATLRIAINGNINYRNSEAIDSAVTLLLDQLINAEQAKNWQTQQRSTVNHAPFGDSNWWVRIETNRDGIYRITREQLSGLPVNDIDPREFRLFSTSGKVLDNTYNQSGPEFKEVPIQVTGEADASFDSADYILFYGSSRDSFEQNVEVQSDPIFLNPYSQNQVFWLTFGGSFDGSPRRIETQEADISLVKGLNSTPEVKHVETESQRREDNGFTWYGSRFFGNSTAEYQMQTTLSDVDTSGEQALSFRIRQEDSGTGTLHKINVEVNGTPVYSNATTGNMDFIWSGNGFYTFNRPVSSLINGNNIIKIKVIRSSTDNLLFDWYRLSYRQTLEKTTGQKVFTHPYAVFPVDYRFNLSGNLDNVQVFRADGIYNVAKLNLTDSYFVSSGVSATKYYMFTSTEAYGPTSIQVVEPVDLTADTAQIDNVIVTSSEFQAQAQTLAQKYWDIYGVRSRVVMQDDIFNQFNGGHPDPAAIRQAMRYYYFNLPSPRISSLTLIGLGTIDWRNFSGSAASKNKLIVWQGDYILSDDYFGMINNDYYPEIGIGRYPVKNTGELDIMLQNFTNYTTNPTPGWWRNSMVFLGDDLNNGTSTYEYIHTQQTEDAANTVNPSVLVDRIFALEYEYDEFQNKPRAREDMFKAINEGRLLWYYIGHGSFDKLGAEDYLNGATDMGRFNNHGKLPFFIAASCKVSHFDYWGFESLGQKVVQLNDLGAIASYSATRLSYPDNNHPMVKHLLRSLANNRNSLGYSIMDAKIRYTESNSNDAVYVLLGDPVLRVIPPERDSTLHFAGLENTAKAVQHQATLGERTTTQSTTAKDVTLHSRETVTINGQFPADGLSGEAEIMVFDTRKSYSLGPATTVSHMGNMLFKGITDVSGSAYQAGFIVPDDISTGNSGLIVSYYWDPITKKDYSNYHYPLGLSDQAVNADNPDIPKIDIYLGSADFRAGDTVGTNTTLLATISDSNGINITGASGHSILLVIDNALQPISITDYFSYDKGSYTKGSLSYPLSDLSEGMHTIQVIAFDNFNQPSVATTNFNAKKSSELAIDRLLIYPNPISSDGHITFMMSDNAELNIGIYTITGKKIRTLKAMGKDGFNKVYWDGKDDKGSKLANNTYFVKVKATSTSGKSTEQTEKLVIFK